MALEGKLKVLEGFVRDKMIILPTDKPYVIGRDRECDMALMSRRVSRRHAEITFRNGAFGIKDLESKTGVLVNNNKVSGTVLRTGDVITLGDIKVKFLYEEPAPTQAPPPKPAVNLPKPVVSPARPAAAAPAPAPAAKPAAPASVQATKSPVPAPAAKPPPPAPAPKPVAASPAAPPKPPPRPVPQEVPADMPQTEPMAAEDTEPSPLALEATAEQQVEPEPATEAEEEPSPEPEPAVETATEAEPEPVVEPPTELKEKSEIETEPEPTPAEVAAVDEDTTESEDKEATPPPPYTDQELAMIGRVVGGIKIIATLGRGRRTVVFKGTQSSHNRVVALRMLTTEAARDPEIVRWFITGAKNAGELRHEDIVTPLGGGREAGAFFVYSKFMENRCAKDVFARAVAGNVPLVKRALEALVHVVRALEYGQSRNILHLGIRPSKLLFDELWHAKLNGLAFDNTLSAPGGAATPEIQAYLAPEQITGGGPVTILTDLCSLGATFYYLLTGQRPERDRKQRIPSPKRLNPVVPDSLCRIVEKMSDPDVNARYRSYGQLLHDLRWALRGEAWPHTTK